MINKFHDLDYKDISEHDKKLIKSWAVTRYVETPEDSQVNLVIHAFMDYLTSKSYRIIKEQKEEE
jgi:hypothetical protein